MSKADLRAIMKTKRNNLDENEKQMKDSKILEILICDISFALSRVIFAYVSFGNEAGTHSIINYALSQGKTVCVPKVINNTGVMCALKIDSLKSMCESNYGILEPQDDAVEIPKDEIDLVLVPGLAFDLEGGRIGYGGGYYDRFLNGMRKDALKLGLAYDFQITDKIKTEQFDISIDGVITESGFKKWQTRKMN